MECKLAIDEIPWERSLRYDAMVFGMVILALIAGWTMKCLVEGKRTTFTDPKAQITLQYPSSWTSLKEKGRLLSVRNLRAEGSFKAGFVLEVRDSPAENIQQVQELVAPISVERGRELNGYRVLYVSEAQVGHAEAVQIEYVYVDTPKGAAMQSSLPVVVKAIDLLFLYQDNLFVLTFIAPVETFPAYSGIFNDIHNSVILGP